MGLSYSLLSALGPAIGSDGSSVLITDPAYLAWVEAGNVAQIVPFVVPAAMQIAGLQAQLLALDSYIPRGLEDLIAAQAFDVTKLPAIQQQRLAQKTTLRAQIVALGG